MAPGQPVSLSLSGTRLQDLHFQDKSLSLLLEVLGNKARRKLENGGDPLVSVSF